MKSRRFHCTIVGMLSIPVLGFQHKNLGPTLSEIRALRSDLHCDGLHNGEASVDKVLASTFSSFDLNKDEWLSMSEAQAAVSKIPAKVKDMLSDCIETHHAPLAVLLRTNSCALCYNFDRGDVQWPVKSVQENSGLCATSRHCELALPLSLLPFASMTSQ